MKEEGSAISDHFHYADEIHGAADQHHRHYDLECELRELRDSFALAGERLRELEDRVKSLEAQTPSARRLQYEADIAMADAMASETEWHRGHSADSDCPECYVPPGERP